MKKASFSLKNFSLLDALGKLIYVCSHSLIMRSLNWKGKNYNDKALSDFFTEKRKRESFSSIFYVTK